MGPCRQLPSIRKTVTGKTLCLLLWRSAVRTKTNSYSSTSPRSQGSSNSSEGNALDSGVHLTILRTKSRKPFLLETSRFLSESSQDTDRTGFRHFQLPVDIRLADAHPWNQVLTSVIEVNGAALASLEELEGRRSQKTNYTSKVEAVPIVASLGVKPIEHASVLKHVPDLETLISFVLLATCRKFCTMTPTFHISTA